MIDWHPDLIVAERRMADLRAQAERERVADASRRPRDPLRLRIHFDIQVTLGRSDSRSKPAPQP